MGYLNYNLEKVASAVKGGMEKKALSLRDLLRMENTARMAGKLKRFEELINKRNVAIPKVVKQRHQSLIDAVRAGKLAREDLGMNLNTHVPGYLKEIDASKTLQALMANKRVFDNGFSSKVAFGPINAGTLTRANLKAQSLTNSQVKNLHENLIKELDDHYMNHRFY